MFFPKFLRFGGSGRPRPEGSTDLKHVQNLKNISKIFKILESFKKSFIFLYFLFLKFGGSGNPGPEHRLNFFFQNFEKLQTIQIHFCLNFRFFLKIFSRGEFFLKFGARDPQISTKPKISFFPKKNSIFCIFSKIFFFQKFFFCGK